MKRIQGYFFDEAGACPSCGAALRPVPYYRGRRLYSSVHTTGGYVRTTTFQSQYEDVRLLRGGYCEACERKQFEARQREVPSPKGPLAGAVVLLVLLGGLVAFGGINPLGWDRERYAPVLMILLVAGMIALAVSALRGISRLAARRRVNSGRLEPFPVRSDDELSEALAKALNETNVTQKNMVCFGVKQMRQMQAQNPFG